MNMKRMKQFLAISIAALSALQAHAQTFQTDYMTHHNTPTGPMGNIALHKDDASNTYYVAQQTLPSDHNSIIFSEMDANHDIIRTYKYTAVVPGGADGELVENNNMYITVRDINFFDEQVIIVGDYIEEGLDRGGFMFCANKNTGAFMWFQKHTGVYTLWSVVCNSAIGGAIAVGWRDNINGGGGHKFPITSCAGVIMRTNAAGGIIWQTDVEDDKYMGHPQNITGIHNVLLEVKQLNDEHFIAVGRTGSFLNSTFPYNDGDGALLVFDAAGNFASQWGMGNITPVMNGGWQNVQYDHAGSATPCSDGDVVVVGNVIKFPSTDLETTCPGPTPNLGGIWVTKINPYSGVIAWSKLFDWWPNPYDPNSFPQPHNIKVENDGTDNFGIIYHSDVEAIMKVDINGNLLYTRNYTYPGYGNMFMDISTGFGNTNIVAVGYITNGDGLAVTAFDNIIDYCNSAILPVQEYQHPYEVFPIEIQGYVTTTKAVLFIQPDEQITNTIDCEWIEVEDGDMLVNKKGSEMVAISQDLQSLAVWIDVPAGQTYKGKLINGMGQVIQILDNVQERYTLNTNGLAAGIYYLHLQNGTQYTTKSVLVQ
jgi:hypothetical protein